MSSYQTPPTIDKILEQEMKAFASIASKNAPAIANALLSKALLAAGITKPKISLKSLIQLTDKLIIPTIHSFEGGWSDHPNDSGGATMRGVIVSSFTTNFDSIFLNTGVSEVKTAATNWNTKYPTWKTDLEFSKRFMYMVLGDAKVAGLWIHKFLASKSNRYPIAIMTEDPFLGFFFVECCWGSGPGVYGKNRADFDTLLSQYGWSGSQTSWSSFILSLGDKTPEIATKCLLNRFNHIMRISKPESKNGVFRKGWLNRLINDKNSNMMMMIKINETFNLNESGLFSFTTAEAEHLNRKAAIYKTVELDFPV